MLSSVLGGDGGVRSGVADGPRRVVAAASGRHGAVVARSTANVLQHRVVLDAALFTEQLVGQLLPVGDDTHQRGALQHTNGIHTIV